MKRLPPGALAGLLLIAAGCEPTEPDPTPPDPPCVAEVLAANGCTGCHTAQNPEAGLDLTSAEIGARMIGAPAHAASCADRLLIDPQRPERSLLLQSVGATRPPSGDEDPCQLVMPPGRDAASDPELRACLTDWVYGIALAQPPEQPHEPTPVAAALAKVKALVDGEPPTAEELAAVTADPGALRGMIDGWADPAANARFREKLASFMVVALQQRVTAPSVEQFNNLQSDRSYRPLVARVLQESFVRTALDIVDRGAPWTEIVTTRRWMMTTANLVMLLYTDQTAAERATRHQLAPPGDDPPSIADQVAAMTWAVPGLPDDLGRCARGIPQFEVLDLLHGFVAGRCNGGGAPLRWPDAPLTAADFEDWRPIELVNSAEAGDVVQFYDLPTLRAAEGTVRVRTPRRGFFTTQAFLSNWPTNVDNQFRVTINQTVLAGLHGGFSQTEPTPRVTADDAAIPLDHVESVDSACYGCHKNMDPMRIYFAQSYTVEYQRPFAEALERGGLIYDPMPESGFALLGHSRLGGGINALGATLASHPRFAIAWAQKVCLYANSARCDEADPQFLAIVDRFRDGHDFRRLFVDILASPLVTGLEQTSTWGADGPLVSITRRDHLCPMLEARTGVDGICESGRVRNMANLIPRDDYARGVADPVQPSLPSAFHYAAARAACESMAQIVVRFDSALYSPADPVATLDRIVTRLMALPAGHSRRADAVDAVQSTYQAARDAGLNARDGLRAAFALGCLSPDVMGVGL